MQRKLRKGDQIVVIAGNDRGKVGKVLRFLSAERLVIEGVNVRKKHMRRTSQQQKGQIVDIERSVHISNVKPCVDGVGVNFCIRSNNQGEREICYLKEGKEMSYRKVLKAKE